MCKVDEGRGYAEKTTCKNEKQRSQICSFYRAGPLIYQSLLFERESQSTDTLWNLRESFSYKKKSEVHVNTSIKRMSDDENGLPRE